MKDALLHWARVRTAIPALAAGIALPVGSLVVALGCRTAAAEDIDALCAAQLPAGAVRVQTLHAIPQVSYTHSAREIRQRLGAKRGTVALGLTQTSTSLVMEVLLHRAVSEDGLHSCARPEIDVILSHSAIEVMLASEIESDACVAGAVLNHEMTHVAIERETLDEAARTVGMQMQEYYRERVLHGDDSQVTAEIAQQFEQRWAPALQALLGASNLRHAEHDERDSYGDKEACQGALIRLARSIE
jgi:hypothetical protein